MFLLQFSLVCYLIYAGVLCAPVSKTKYDEPPSAKVLNFMKKFGYIEKGTGKSAALYTEEGFSEIIKTIQKYGAIEQTGKVDNATLKLMSSRRCGVPDVTKHKRVKRYEFASYGWNKRNLSYYVANRSLKLRQSQYLKSIQQALDIWGYYGGLTFQRTFTPNADIIISFAYREHGDGYPFDGQGGVLAHAFFPHGSYNIDGDVHFDADENWVDKKTNPLAIGTDFFSVALHEFGHSLGLAHSNVYSSIMFPYYKKYDPNKSNQLDYDDICGIHNLYNPREPWDCRAYYSR